MDGVTQKTVRRGRLVAVDGLDLHAVRTAARETVRRLGAAQCGVSHWDASGVFHELELVDGAASPRTLLLLYAADLAFRADLVPNSMFATNYRLPRSIPAFGINRAAPRRSRSSPGP